MRILSWPVISVLLVCVAGGLALSSCITGLPNLNLSAVAPVIGADDSSNTDTKTIDPVAPRVRLDREFTRRGNDFGFRLFSMLAEKENDKNVFISTPSISLALSMVYNGADGETKDTMAKVLPLGSGRLEAVNAANSAITNSLQDPNSGVNLMIGNSVWAKDNISFIADFMQRCEVSYQAELKSLKFEDPKSVDIINAWVDNKTQGKIKRLINELDPMTYLVVVNTVYFKGAWRNPFDPAATQPHDFMTPDGKITVPMMSAENDYIYQKNDDFEAVILPYAGTRMSMYVFLPSEELGLNGFIKKLNAENWQKWVTMFRPAEGTVMLPKFKSEYDTHLRDLLVKMGLGIAFDRNQADFSQMCSERTWLSEVIHKTFVEVNEEGTEAAAATAAVAVGSIMPPEPPPTFKMVVDRPFFCVIRDNETGLLLFMGAIKNPGQS